LRAKVFTIDPVFVREAVLKGLTLVVEVSDRHTKVTLGPPSPHTMMAEEMRVASQDIKIGGAS
jgi:hypothetical protein